MGFQPTLRPDEDVFLAAIAELGQVTSLLAERFGATRDAVRRWYEFYGIDAPYKYKLKKEDIPYIRRMEGVMSARELGKLFRVGDRTIRDVWNGTYWGWVKMSKMKKQPVYATGDRVSHQGMRWRVHSVFGGLVKIININDEFKTVRLNQVSRVASNS